MDVKSVMTADPACCSSGTSLREVAQMMVDNDCGEIPVVDESHMPIGVVTDRDIVVRVIAQGHDPASARAADCMSMPATTVDLDCSLEECCETMESQQIRRVPVVDTAGRLCGIVSLADVALHGRDKKTGQLVQEVSEPGQSTSAH